MSRKILTRDEWFYDICQAVAKGSKCLSRQIGTVLVKDNSIISTGYNGPPRGVPHCWERYNLDPKLQALLTQDGKTPSDEDIRNICPRYIAGFKSGEGLDWCVAGHSEENALLNAARLGIKTKGCKLYMNCQIPCKNCLIKIINCGIEEIIVTGVGFYDLSSEYLLKQSNLKYRIFGHLR